MSHVFVQWISEVKWHIYPISCIEDAAVVFRLLSNKKSITELRGTVVNVRWDPDKEPAPPTILDIGNTMQPNEAEQEIVPGTSHLNPHLHSDRGDASSKSAKPTGNGIFMLLVVSRHNRNCRFQKQKQVLRKLQLMRLMIEQLSERIERAQPVEKSCGREFCQGSGFTFLDELVDNWPGCLSRDGVHPGRFGNKMLADFLHREAFTMPMNLERTRIHQSCRDPQASTWRGCAQQQKVSTISEANFPALGLHAFTCKVAGGPSTAPVAVWTTSTAPVQRPGTDQLARTFRVAGFTLVGGVRYKGSKAWWTWDSLPSPVFYDTSVPSRGNTEGRLVEPKIPGRGA
ncbi:hypothetical protein HPB50_011903 [Hyalomma asiaticum]|uniref:Uncharacterized protein n=1 Tax=Hyalomma asiaticum TaxID=266040 RepID=A0ACB7SG91_HYAAI|nr:hypothetical protein HPB50_011903 [Hyalomma asiaticum]